MSVWGIDVAKRLIIVHADIAIRRDVRAHDRLGPVRGIGSPQRAKQLARDEHGMAVFLPANRPDDGRRQAMKALDDRTDGRNRYQRHVDERHQHRRNTRSVDRIETRQHRRKLAGSVVRIHHEAGLHVVDGHSLDHRVGVMAEDDDHVVDASIQKRVDDGTDECPSVGYAEQRFRLTSHASRQACGEHNGRNHEANCIEGRVDAAGATGHLRLTSVRRRA